MSERVFKTAWFAKAAKKARANIDDDELAAFRKLAELYRRKTTADLEAELGIGALLEIDHGD